MQKRKAKVMLGSCCKQYCVTARHGKKHIGEVEKKAKWLKQETICVKVENWYVCSVWQTHCVFVARTKKHNPVMKRSFSTVQNSNWYFVTNVTGRASTAQIGNVFRLIMQYWTCKFALSARMDEKVVLWRKQFCIEWISFVISSSYNYKLQYFLHITFPVSSFDTIWI